MNNALAGLAATCFGVEHFLGGLASRRVTALTAALSANASAAVVLAAIVGVTGWTAGWRDVRWGVLAGVASAVALLSLYRSLALGPMSVAAPTASVMTGVTGGIAGVLFGEQPQLLTYLGLLTAFSAVVLVGRDGSERSAARASSAAVSRTVAIATLAGACLGLANVAFSRISGDAGFAPILVSRLVTVVAFAAVALVGMRRGTWVRGGAAMWRLTGPAGAIDAIGTLAISVALQRGSLVVVGVLGNMFPVVTVLLARVFIGERLRTSQVAGIALGLSAVAMLAAG